MNIEMMFGSDINSLFQRLRIVSTMVSEQQIRFILSKLVEAEDTPGAVVELGCNIGTTSVFIQALLDGAKEFHVYDSFEGFPEKDVRDHGAPYHFDFKKGAAKVSEDQFRDTFYEFGLPVPVIHKGWFKEIGDWPDRISFAFFDSDFYTSIMDSWQQVYHRLSPGAIVLIHDYAWDVLPGVTAACNDFLHDKPERITHINNIGIFKKQ